MKKKIMSIFLIATLALTTLAGCSGGSSGGGSTTNSNSSDGGAEKTAVTLNLTVPDPDSSYIYAAAEEFTKRANEYSDGTLNFTISTNGSLYGGDSAAGIKQLSSGGLDLVILSTSLYASFNSEFNVISVPFMFDDQAQLTDYLNSDTGKELMSSMEESKITAVGSWTRSFRKITNSKLPITQPSDLSGVVLRVPNNTLYVEYFSACGATTTPMSFSEVYNALQLKTLDGQENPIDVPYSNKFNEVQKYISATDHMADAWLVGMNSDKLASLSEEQQQAILKAGEEVQQWNVDYMATEDEKALEYLLANGMEYNELTAENKEKFVQISQDLYPVFKGLVNNDELFNATTAFCGK